MPSIYVNPAAPRVAIEFNDEEAKQMVALLTKAIEHHKTTGSAWFVLDAKFTDNVDLLDARLTCRVVV